MAITVTCVASQKAIGGGRVQFTDKINKPGEANPDKPTVIINISFSDPAEVNRFVPGDPYELSIEPVED